MLTGVAIPARDEAERLPACLAALASEHPDVVLVVDDGSRDATAALAREAGATVIAGPAAGPGLARRAGMSWLRRELGPGALLCTTDADSTVEPGWLDAKRAAVRAGAGAVGGRIELAPDEAVCLAPAVLAEREREARHRLAAVRGHTPQAEHHQLSGASLALTAQAHDAVGGIPALAVLEDEALEHALRAAGIPIAYTLAARVTTSARTTGRAARGLAQVLRTAQWAAAPSGGTGTGRGGPRSLLDALEADPRLALVKATGPPHPLDEVLVRPLLALGAPELTALASPANAGWVARADVLDSVRRPPGPAADVTVLVDVHARYGLDAIAQVDVDGGPQPAATGELAYAIAAALRTRLDHTLPASARYGSARLDLGER